MKTLSMPHKNSPPPPRLLHQTLPLSPDSQPRHLQPPQPTPIWNTSNSRSKHKSRCRTTQNTPRAAASLPEVPGNANAAWAQDTCCWVSMPSNDAATTTSAPGTGTGTPPVVGRTPTATGEEKGKRKMSMKSWSSSNAEGRGRKKMDYSLGTVNDIVGIVMLETQSADDLPRLKNNKNS
jgi:phosphatidylserine decarboxylase